MGKFSNLAVGVPGDVRRPFEQSTQIAVLKLFALSNLCVGENMRFEAV